MTTMTDKTWKAAERQIARIFGGQRRGADYKKKDGGGKSDIILDGWSIEVKHNKRPFFQLMFDAAVQAEKNRENPTDIPIAVIHKAGTPYKDSLVIMRIETFQDFFV